MEKNKNKKKLFAIIGGSVLAFVLTIALSVSITLAYFGDAGKTNATVTLGKAVELNEVTTLNANVTVIPTQKAVVNAKADCKATTTDSVLIAVVEIAKGTGSADLSADTITKNVSAVTIVDTTVSDDNAGTWEPLGTNAYVYTLTDDSIFLTSDEAFAKGLQYSFITPSTFVNSDQDSTLNVNIYFVRAQVIYQDNGVDLETDATKYIAVANQILSADTETKDLSVTIKTA